MYSEVTKINSSTPTNDNNTGGPSESQVPKEDPLDLSNVVSTRPTVLFIFRHNGHYETCLASCEKALKEAGYSVRWHTFIAGTPEEEIAAELEQYKQDLNFNLVVVDYTCARNLGLSTEFLAGRKSSIAGTIDGTVADAQLDVLKERYFIADNRKKNGQISLEQERLNRPESGNGPGNGSVSKPQRLLYLPEDRLEAVWGKKLRPSKRYVDEYGKVVSAVFREALANQERGLPRDFLILPQCLVQHAPFMRFFAALISEHSKKFGDGADGISCAMFDPRDPDNVLISSQFSSEHLKRFSESIKAPILQPYQNLAKWVENAGVPAGRIQVAATLRELLEIDLQSRRLTILADRHVFRDLEKMLAAEGLSSSEITRLKDSFKEHVLLPMPLENLRPALLRGRYVHFSANEEARIEELIRFKILDKVSAALGKDLNQT